jgi:hypothetical protein
MHAIKDLHYVESCFDKSHRVSDMLRHYNVGAEMITEHQTLNVDWLSKEMSPPSLEWTLFLVLDASGRRACRSTAAILVEPSLQDLSLTGIAKRAQH